MRSERDSSMISLDELGLPEQDPNQKTQHANPGCPDCGGDVSIMARFTYDKYGDTTNEFASKQYFVQCLSNCDFVEMTIYASSYDEARKKFARYTGQAVGE